MQSPERMQPLAHLRAASLPSPAAQNVDDAADDADRVGALAGGEPGGHGRRASRDAFAAAGAGVDHGVDAGFARADSKVSGMVEHYSRPGAD